MIKYAEPLSKAMARMTKALFKPFDFKKWLYVGFTAFLAGLTDFNGGGNSRGESHFDPDEFFQFPSIALNWLQDNPLWAALIFVGVVILIVLFIIALWVSSRGKFMFLDNVVHDRMEVSKPWNEFSSLGNSLFLWRLVFGVIIAAVFITALVFGFIIAYNLYYDYEGAIKILPIIGAVILFLVAMTCILYVDCFLDNFVVPIMYKHNLKTMNAWGKFMSLASPKMGHFILFGLFKALLNIAIVIGIILVGFLTCCIGFLLLIIPYIGALILLPISYTFRAFGVEFLEQFGDDYKLFPERNDIVPGVLDQ